MSAIKQIALLVSLLLVTAFRTTAPAQAIVTVAYPAHLLHQSSDKAKTVVTVASDSVSFEEDQDTSDEGISLFADLPTFFSFSFTSGAQETAVELTKGHKDRPGANRPYYLLFHALRIPSC